MRSLFSLTIILLGSLLYGAPVTVVSLHPLATDWLQQVGGEQVRVISLLDPGEDPHVFEPSPQDLKKTIHAKVFFAMGKNLEIYLSDLHNALSPEQEIFEIGKYIPSLVLSEGDQLFACCPKHAVGAIDPHWWHDPKLVSRAVKQIAHQLGKIDPEHKALYQSNAKTYAKKVEELHHWAEEMIHTLPPHRRKLTTSHAAFNYFCRAYGFQAVPIKGISSQDTETPEHLRAVTETLQKKNIPVIFPDVSSSQKILRNLQQQTGVALGEVLYPDSPPAQAPTYEAMFRHNVNAIVRGLSIEP